MTWDETYEYLLQGYSVRHEYFSDNEWMKAVYECTVEAESDSYFFKIKFLNLRLEFEEGVRCTVKEFFAHRQGEKWQTGWSIVEQ